MESNKRKDIQKRAADAASLEADDPGIREEQEMWEQAQMRDVMDELYYVYGSIEGELIVSDEQKDIQFFVEEVCNKDKIDCEIPKTLIARAKSLHGEHVTLYGLVLHKEKDGQPTFIRVDELDHSPVDHRLISEMGPIDITDGMPSEEYVRRLRDED